MTSQSKSAVLAEYRKRSERCLGAAEQLAADEWCLRALGLRPVLTDAQARIHVRILLEAAPVRYNGRAERILKRLEALGLIKLTCERQECRRRQSRLVWIAEAVRA